MATIRQRQAAKKNIKKARAQWQSMTPRQHALAQPEGPTRKRPGAGSGRYYRVEVRPKTEFIRFRTQEVGKRGHIERVAGKRASGSWDTVTWLISKEDAHVQNGRLIADSIDARKLIDKQGDRFEAKDRPNVPERAKPTAAQKRARRENIKKAQAARRRK